MNSNEESTFITSIIDRMRHAALLEKECQAPNLSNAVAGGTSFGPLLSRHGTFTLPRRGEARGGVPRGDAELMDAPGLEAEGREAETTRAAVEIRPE